jgi:hypothetical protein
MEQARQVEHMGDMRNVYKILDRKIEGKRQFGKPKCRGENTITMYLRRME